MNITQCNPQLMISIKKNCMNLECSVCYKKINRTYFICSSPCNKVFHMDCMDKMMEQTEEAAYEANEEAVHKCCYCRRTMSLRNYRIQLFVRHLTVLRNMGYYDVTDALRKLMILRYSLCHVRGENDYPKEDESYEIYELRDNTYIKKPKQAKRALFKKTIQKQPRVHIKQNIGGRRRS